MRNVWGIVWLLVFGFTSLSVTAHAATFKGKVVSPDAKPVAGATVYISESRLPEYSEKDGTLKRLTTGEDGTFTFEFADKPDVKPLAFVRVMAEKFAIYDTVLKVGDTTLSLKAPKPVRGLVKDGAGVPVADAVVRVTFSIGDMNAFEGEAESGGGGMPLIWSMMNWAASLPPVETRSGADGRWSFDNIFMALLSLQDPRFASTPGYANLPGAPGGEGLVSLVAKPAASLKGRIVTPDDKPLAGIIVLGNNELSGKPVRTDENGEFLLTGLPTENVHIMGITTDTEWIIPPLGLKQKLEPGKVNQAPEWKATRGIEVTGTVIDKKTNAPIVGAIVGSGMGGHAKTGADGRFKMRVASGQAVIVVNHPQYAHFWKHYDKIGNVTTFEVGKIALDTAVALEGRLIDDKGQPIKDVMLIFSNETNGKGTQTDAEGKFKVQIAPGSFNVQMQTEGWELLPNRELKIEVKEDNKPIEVKARKLPTLPVKGRIVTTDGKPVVGATVNVTASIPRGDNSNEIRQKSAETDAEGLFTVEFAGNFKDPKVAKVEGGNYLLRKSGTGKLQDGVWQLSDTTVAALTAQVSGRVLNMDGKPIVGALVAAPEAAKFEPVKTDAEGRFTLKNLPEGEAAILAAQGKDFSRVTVKTGAEADVKMVPGGVFIKAMQRQLFEQLVKDDLSAVNYYRAALSPEKRLALALQKDGALPAGEFDITKANWKKAQTATGDFIVSASRHDAQWLAQNHESFRAAMAQVPPTKETADVRFDAEYAFALASAFKGDEKARAWANEWLATASKQKDAPNDHVKNASRLFRLAGLAGALGRADADGHMIAALNFAEQSGKKAMQDNAFRWGMWLAPAGPALFSTLEDEWPLDARINAWAGAVDALVRTDMARATPFLDKLKAMREDAAFKKRITEAGGDNLQSNISASENRWRRAQIAADPAAAWTWFQTLKPEQYDWQLLSKIVRAAVDSKNYEMAKKAMALQLEQDWAQDGMFAYYGAMAATFDKDLAARFWAKADKFIMDNSSNMAADAALNYGFFRAQSDPALARLWLEWMWQRAQTTRDEQNKWQSDTTLARVAGAMIALDALRAVEMLGDPVFTSTWERNASRAHIVAYLLADEAQRPLLYRDYN